jgi:hypothetical protein
MKCREVADCPLLIITLAFLITVAFGSIAQGETARRITLPRPGKSLRIAGKLHGLGEKREFVFHALTGTKLKIELSGAGPLRGEITVPSGNQMGSPGGTVFDQVLKESGQYRLEVVESPMGESWGGAFNITISVSQ